MDLVGLVGLVGLAACASQKPPAARSAPAAAPVLASAAPAGAAVRLLDAAAARPTLLASISVTSLDRLLTNGATLVARAVPLPIEPAGLRDMLLGQAGLSPEVAANLDLGAPSGAVVVSTGAVGGTSAVMAVAARGAAEAARVVGALGRQIEKRGDIVLIDNGSGGRGWIFRDGNVIVFSDDIEALARGARLAEEARHAVPEDVTAVLYPEALARANGTDVKTALAIVSAQLQQAQGPASQPGAGGAAGAQDLLALMSDAETVELGLGVDAAKGLSVRARLHARASSGLEKVARDAHPFDFDATLLAVSPTPAAASASSIGAFMRAQMARQLDVLRASKAKGAAGALAFQQALVEGLAGQVSFVLRFEREAPLFAAQLSYALKDAAAATALAGALAHLDKDAARALAEAQGRGVDVFSWTAKSETVAKVKAVHYALTLKKELGLDAAVEKKIFGGKGLDAYLAVVGSRLVTTIGRGAKADLGRLVVAKPAAATGALAETLVAAKGRDSFIHFDVAPLVSTIGTLGSLAKSNKDKRLAALARASTGPIPLFGTAGGEGGGKAFSFDLSIPPTAFVNAGGLFKAAMAAGLGGERK